MLEFWEGLWDLDGIVILDTLINQQFWLGDLIYSTWWAFEPNVGFLEGNLNYVGDPLLFGDAGGFKSFDPIQL